MRTLLFLLLCISTSFAIAQISPKAVEKNKEAEIDSLESEMMNFFQATLERNYGRKDALDLLVKGLDPETTLVIIVSKTFNPSS